jgi:translation initiation factor IF-1
VAAKEKIEVTGEVVEAPRSGNYRIVLEHGGDEVVAYTAAKTRTHRIRIVVGDQVRVELSPYHVTPGRPSSLGDGFRA